MNQKKLPQRSFRFTESDLVHLSINFYRDILRILLGEGNLIFGCTGPTDSNFWQAKIIIILILYINISFLTIHISFETIFFF